MSLPGAMKGIGRNSLDLPVAALAALATAYLAFTLPPDLLAQLVGSTGLPQLLPAAEPPLGNTARLALGIVGAAAIFAFVFTLLRLIDRKTAEGKGEGAYRMPEQAFAQPANPPVEQAPKVRRRDAHPDAPARRPILASLEFGDPEVPEPASKAPLWLSPAEAEGAAADFEERPETTEPAPPVCAEPESAVEPASEPAFEPAPDPAFEPARPQSSLEGETIAQLMARLETGLARRRQSNDQEAPVASREKAPAEPAAKGEDDRLQSAIDNLQRLASRID